MERSEILKRLGEVHLTQMDDYYYLTDEETGRDIFPTQDWELLQAIADVINEANHG